MKTHFNFILFIFLFVFSQSVFAHNDQSHAPAGHLVYKHNTVHVHAQFLRLPEVNKEAELVLETRDALTHQIIDIEDNLEVFLWMPNMGHGSAPTQVERKLNAQGEVVPGVFLVRNVYFTMGGLWDIRVSLIDSNGKIETKSFSLSLAGDNHGGHH